MEQVQIQALRERNQEFGNQMDVIGNGLNNLMNIAQKQGEEVKRQGAMLDSPGNKIEGLNEKWRTQTQEFLQQYYGVV